MCMCVCEFVIHKSKNPGKMPILDTLHKNNKNPDIDTDRKKYVIPQYTLLLALLISSYTCS